MNEMNAFDTKSREEEDEIGYEPMGPGWSSGFNTNVEELRYPARLPHYYTSGSNKTNAGTSLQLSNKDVSCEIMNREKVVEEKEERFFSIELGSKASLKNASLASGTRENVLVEGTIGKLLSAEFQDGLVLEVVGSKGVVRINLTEREICPKQMVTVDQALGGSR